MDVFQMKKTYPRATDVTISEHYIAYATGGSVTVLDRTTEEILFQVKKLLYCYSVFINKRETVLIVRGTEPILRFYSLPDGGLLKRLALKSAQPQDHACVLDEAGEYLLYPLYNNDLCTTLLKISLSIFAVTETIPIGVRACVGEIWLAEDGTFLVSGYDRANEGEEWHTFWVAWCDGERITRKIVIDEAFIEGTDNILYDKKRGFIYLIGDLGKYFVVDEEMQLIREGNLEFRKGEYCSGDLYLDDCNLYIPSCNAFYIYDRDTFQCLFCSKRNYGFLGVKRLSDTQVLAVPFSGGAFAIDVQ